MNESAGNIDSANLRPLSQLGILPTLIIPRSYRIEAYGTLVDKGVHREFEFTSCPLISTWRTHISGKIHSFHDLTMPKSSGQQIGHTVHVRPPANDPSVLTMCWALPIWSSGEGAYTGDFIPAFANRTNDGRFIEIEFDSDVRFGELLRSARLRIDTRFNIGVHYALEYEKHPVFSMTIVEALFYSDPSSSASRVSY